MYTVDIQASDNSPLTDTSTTQVLACHFGEMPEFPGGESALMDFLKSNLQYPDVDSQVTGKVIVLFTIDETGCVYNIRIKKSLTPPFDREALRVINILPQFNPGRGLRGQPIRADMAIPFQFAIADPN